MNVNATLYLVECFAAFCSAATSSKIFRTFSEILGAALRAQGCLGPGWWKPWLSSQKALLTRHSPEDSQGSWSKMQSLARNEVTALAWRSRGMALLSKGPVLKAEADATRQR